MATTTAPTNPYAGLDLDAKEFLRQVTPLVAKKEVDPNAIDIWSGDRSPTAESNPFWTNESPSYDKDGKMQTVELKTADGRTLRPSGGGSRIEFVPKGAMIPSGRQLQTGFGDDMNFVPEMVENPKDMYLVTTDTTRLNRRDGSQEDDSNSNTTIAYTQEGDKMVAMSQPTVADYRYGGWHAVKPLAQLAATAAAMYYGVGALGAAAGGGAAATGAAAATPATGLAGTLGMNAGVGATALNAGALNTGISLVQGKNIGDSLKSGVMAAALSPVGGWAKSAIGGATSEVLGKTMGGIVGKIGAGAATGAAGAALTGQDIGKGFTNGIISGAINSVGGAAGKLAKDATGSNLVGGVTSAAVSNTLSPKKKNITTAAINGALDDFTDPMASVNKYLGFAAA